MDSLDIVLPQSLIPVPVTDHLRDLPVFAYEPLESDQHIRLLRTRGGCVKSPDLVLSLSHTTLLRQYEIIQVDLKDLPQYYAVSYTWGDPDKTHAIEISGTYRLCITNTLAIALPRLTRICSTGLLWIDQICIDQSNLQERNQQVKIMGQIYKNAEEVVIWTGEDVSGLHEIKSLIPHPNKFSRDNIETMVQFLCRPWFRRAWTIQEAVLAKRATFVAGSCLIPMLDFERAWNRSDNMWTRDQLERVWAGMTCYETIMALRAEVGVRRNWDSGFDGLLNRLGHTQTSDPRDHVYAFLSLKSDLRVTIVPDYNLSTSEVFTAAARAIIEGTKSLDTFRFCLKHEKSTHKSQLPSWVPDWSTTNSENRILKDTAVQNQPFDAARGFRHRVCNTTQPQQNELLVYGRIIDFVELHLPYLVRPIYDSMYSHKQESQRIYKRIFQRKRKPQRFFSLSDKEVAILDKTAFMDQTQSLRKRIVTVLVAGLIGAEEILRWYDEGIDEPHDLSLQLRRLQDQPLVHTRQRKLALTPPEPLVNLRRGDAIAILHGLDVPLVLRQLIDGTYMVAGQCYLEDAMFGETVTWEEHEADCFTLV